jgi:hypothetical protein
MVYKTALSGADVERVIETYRAFCQLTDAQKQAYDMAHTGDILRGVAQSIGVSRDVSVGEFETPNCAFAGQRLFYASCNGRDQGFRLCTAHRLWLPYLFGDGRIARAKGGQTGLDDACRRGALVKAVQCDLHSFTQCAC